MSEIRQMNLVIKEAVREIESLKDKEGGLTGITSGFTKLDRITSGFQKSDLIIIAARPGMGKTSLALSIARNASLIKEDPSAIVVFSLEMSRKQIVTRMISAESEVAGERIRKGTLVEHEWQQLNSKIARINEAPIFIDDTHSILMSELRKKCFKLKEENNIELIVIDVLQSIIGDDPRNIVSNRNQEIGFITRSLKGLAKELDVPIIATSQLNRASEKRGTGAIPILSDLRESGSIEDDADMVIFLHRPECYGLTELEDGSSSHGIAELFIAKNRNGALDRLQLRFVHEFTKFKDITNFEYSSDPDMMMDHSGTVTVSSKLSDMGIDDDEYTPAPF